MSGNKKEAMFAKLIAQQPQPVADELPVTVEPASEQLPPSPAPPEVRAKTAKPKSPAAQVKGKRDNPDYCQANAYVPKALRKAVDRALLDVDGLDYSTLVEDLLRKWVKSRGVAE